MGSNLHQFEIGIDDFVKREVPRLVKTVQQKIALQALRRVVLKTPIDTGHARANWQVATDDPATGVLEGFDVSGNVTITRGEEVIARIEPFGVIWLSNNLKYADALEAGHSKQAPAGMVAITVAELKSQFEG